MALPCCVVIVRTVDSSVGVYRGLRKDTPLAQEENALRRYQSGGGGVLDRSDVLDIMHGRSRITIDP